MKNKKLKYLILFLLFASFSSGVTLLQKTYKPNFERVVLKTSEGATIHEKLDTKGYDGPIEGTYMIVGPEDKKWMLASNVRGWHLMTFIPLLIVTYLVTYLTIKEKKQA